MCANRENVGDDTFRPAALTDLSRRLYPSSTSPLTHRPSHVLKPARDPSNVLHARHNPTIASARTSSNVVWLVRWHGIAFAVRSAIVTFSAVNGGSPHNREIPPIVPLPPISAARFATAAQCLRFLPHRHRSSDRQTYRSQNNHNAAHQAPPQAPSPRTPRTFATHTPALRADRTEQNCSSATGRVFSLGWSRRRSPGFQAATSARTPRSLRIPTTRTPTNAPPDSRRCVCHARPARTAKETGRKREVRCS